MQVLPSLFYSYFDVYISSTKGMELGVLGVVGKLVRDQIFLLTIRSVILLQNTVNPSVLLCFLK